MIECYIENDRENDDSILFSGNRNFDESYPVAKDNPNTKHVRKFRSGFFTFAQDFRPAYQFCS